MIFTQEALIQVAILFLGLFGFWVARRIYNHKTKKKPLVCMVGFDCHAVVHSDYSKFMGIRVEILGMLYYAAVSIFYFLIIFFPFYFLIIFFPNFFLSSFYTVALLFLMPLFSFAAFLFSTYLIAVQIFILKKGCSWCIVSAFITFFIFLLTLFNYGFISLT